MLGTEKGAGPWKKVKVNIAPKSQEGVYRDWRRKVALQKTASFYIRKI